MGGEYRAYLDELSRLRHPDSGDVANGGQNQGIQVGEIVSDSLNAKGEK